MTGRVDLSKIYHLFIKTECALMRWEKETLVGGGGIVM